VRMLAAYTAQANHAAAEHPRIKARIEEGEAKRNKRSNLESLLSQKISSVRYPMQELELSYPTTKGKVFSEEEDRYLLCRLNHYGMATEDVYERIKQDITEFPVFRFDWFFKSRSPQELQRRCNTLLGMIEKEAEAEAKLAEASKPKTSTSRGKVCLRLKSIVSSLMSTCQKRAAEESKEEKAPAPAAKARPAKKKKA
jgi:SWI/SNF-related matrix-associated actin-dependent regulator of chromatin subfamily A member 5